MRVCGVICEYNPFHRGHALHLARARALSQADYVVCAMSGAITQRGAFARHDKWTRTRMALEGGADLVLELPVRFASAPAPDFASGGVALLADLGVVTHLSFGCEAESLPVLQPAAHALSQESPAFSLALRRHLDDGLPFPRARALAVQEAAGIEGLAETVARPNAALALEYLRALPPDIAPVPVMREGSGYHDDALSELSSATAIRAALARGETTAALLALPSPSPVARAEQEGFLHEEEALTQALLYRLRTVLPDKLAQIYGMDEGLHFRFLAAAREASSREALLAAVKNKRYTHARLSRCCTNTLLGVTREFAQAHSKPTYARVLGFRREAQPLLRAIKERGALPLVTKVANADTSNPLFSLDLRAQDLWSLGVKNPTLRQAGLDFTTSPVLL